MTLSNSENSEWGGSFFYQYAATITGSIAIICMGMHFGWPSPSLPLLLDIDSSINTTSEDGSLLAVMPCIGGVLGALIGAYLVDKMGRKNCMVPISPLYFVTWMMIAFSNSILVFNIARFLVGVADGVAFTALPIYIAEIADSNIRGLLGSTISISILTGILLINLLGSYFSIKTTALIASIIPVIHFATFTWMPESPYYYIIKENYEGATASLKKFTGKANVDDEVKSLTAIVREETQSSGKIWNLFTVKSNRRAVYIAMVLRAVQQLSGVNVITFYSQIIFEEAKSGILPHTATIIYFTVQLFMAICSSLLVDKLGRRPLLITSVIGSAFALAAQGIYLLFQYQGTYNMSKLNFIPLLALLFYVVVFNVGMGTIPLMMLGELFPTDVKGFALCLADIYFSVIVTVISKLFQVTKDSFGMHVPFFGFSLSCVLGLVFVVKYVPETKGKTLEEVQSYLKRETKDQNTHL